MKYTMTTPCEECPFLKSMKRGFTIQRLEEFASGQFACHKSCASDESDEGSGAFVANKNSVHCAGSLIYLEKRGRPNQMMRICERIGIYDYRKLDMEAEVR